MSFHESSRSPVDEGSVVVRSILTAPGPHRNRPHPAATCGSCSAAATYSLPEPRRDSNRATGSPLKPAAGLVALLRILPGKTGVEMVTGKARSRVVGVVLLLASCFILPRAVESLKLASPLSEEDAGQVLEWNQIFIDTLIVTNTANSSSQRLGAIVQTAVFDAYNGIDRRYTPIFVHGEAP